MCFAGDVSHETIFHLTENGVAIHHGKKNTTKRPTQVKSQNKRLDMYYFHIPCNRSLKVGETGRVALNEMKK